MPEQIIEQTGQIAQNELLISNYQPIVGSITLISGQNLLRGQVLGRITASGKWTAYAAGASDGSQVARAILFRDTDASGGDAVAQAYRHGEFNREAVIGLGANAAAQRTTTEALEAVGIYLK